MPIVLCPVLVGRAAERDALAARIRDGGVSAVVGAAGIGKSRLVQEIAADARNDGALVFGGRAVAGGRPAPYRPLAEAVAAGCRRGGPPDTPSVAPYRAALGRLVPEWHEPQHAGTVESTVVLGEGVLRLLSAIGGRRPVVLVIEDLHRADPETLAALEYVADHADEGVRLLVTSRPEPGPGWDCVRDIVARRAAIAIELTPLPSDAVADIARRCLDTTVLRSGVDAVLDRAEGVPFLIEELLAHARHRRDNQSRDRRAALPVGPNRGQACRTAARQDRGRPPRPTAPPAYVVPESPVRSGSRCAPPLAR